MELFFVNGFILCPGISIILQTELVWGIDPINLAILISPIIVLVPGAPDFVTLFLNLRQ